MPLTTLDEFVSLSDDEHVTAALYEDWSALALEL
jgi:hypothetical protein